MAPNKIQISPEVTKIFLTRGKVAVIDTTSLDRLHLKHPLAATFIAARNGNTYYVMASNLTLEQRRLYGVERFKGVHVGLHTILHPEWDLVDHIDGDGLNNRLENLRDGNEIGVTGFTVQNENRCLRADNKSGMRNLHCGKQAVRAQWTENGNTVIRDFRYGDDPFQAYLDGRRYLVQQEERIGIQRHTDGDRTVYATPEDIPADIREHILTAMETEEEKNARLELRRKRERPDYANETEEEAALRRAKKAKRERERRAHLKAPPPVPPKDRKPMGPRQTTSNTGIRGVCWAESIQAYIAHWYEGSFQRKRTFRAEAYDSKEKAFDAAKEAREHGVRGDIVQTDTRRSNKLGLTGIQLVRVGKPPVWKVRSTWNSGERDAKGRLKSKNCSFPFDRANPRTALEKAVQCRAEATGQEPIPITDEMCDKAIAAAHE